MSDDQGADVVDELAAARSADKDIPTFDVGELFPEPEPERRPRRVAGRLLAGLLAAVLVRTALDYLEQARDLLRVAAGEDD